MSTARFGEQPLAQTIAAAARCGVSTGPAAVAGARASRRSTPARAIRRLGARAGERASRRFHAPDRARRRPSGSIWTTRSTSARTTRAFPSTLRPSCRNRFGPGHFPGGVTKVRRDWCTAAFSPSSSTASPSTRLRGDALGQDAVAHGDFPPGRPRLDRAAMTSNGTESEGGVTSTARLLARTASCSAPASSRPSPHRRTS